MPTRLRQDVCRFPATHVSKVPDLFLFVLFFSFSSKRETFSSCLFSSSSSSNVGGVVGFSENSCPLPPGLCFFSIFALSFVLFFGAVSQGGASSGGWSGRMKAAGGTIRHPLPLLSTTHPGLTLLVFFDANVEAARPSPLPTSVSYTQSPADFGLNIPPAALNTAGCLPL